MGNLYRSGNNITEKNAALALRFGIFFGFFCSQFIALVILLFFFITYGTADEEYEDGVEYLPVAVTWTNSEENVETYKVRNGKNITRTRTRTVYSNYCSYTVNGTEYTKCLEKQSESVTPGTQETWYYNPNNPTMISQYSSMKEQMASVNYLWIFFGIFQILAIVLIVLFVKKRD